MKVFYSTCLKPNFFFHICESSLCACAKFLHHRIGGLSKKKRRKEKINETKKKEKLIKSSDEHS